MSPALWAFLGAACFAAASVVGKLATNRAPMAEGFLLGLATSTAFLATLSAVLLDSWTVGARPFAFFVGAGLVGTAVGGSLFLRAVRDVGASVAVPLQASANPLVAVAAGVGLLGERFGPERWAPLVLIISGMWLCSRDGSANLVADRLRSRPVELLVPVLAGAAFACGDVLRKFALGDGTDPLLGALIGTSTALITWRLLTLTSPTLRRSGRSARRQAASLWFCLNGALSGAAQLCAMVALSTGDLSTVAPVLASQPVVVILLSAALLHRVERLRTSTVAGAVVAFAGVALLARV